MLIKLLGIDDDPLAILLVLSCSGLLAYFVFSGLSYLVFFVWGKRRFHPDYVADRDENRRARIWGSISVVGNALLMVPFHWALAHGYGNLYWDVGEHGWGYLALSFVLYLAVTETLIYWVHRALHSDFLYGWLHRRHHEFRVTTSWVSTAFHPFDSFAQALPHHLCAFLFPVHGVMYLIMVALVTAWSVNIHDRVSLLRWKLINYTGHHTLHHWYYQYNLGQFTTVWDRLCGTYMDPEVLYEDIPEGVLVRWQDGPGTLAADRAPTPADAFGCGAANAAE